MLQLERLCRGNATLIAKETNRAAWEKACVAFIYIFLATCFAINRDGKRYHFESKDLGLAAGRLRFNFSCTISAPCIARMSMPGIKENM